MNYHGLNVIQNGQLQVLFSITLFFHFTFLFKLNCFVYKDCFDHNNIDTLKNFTFVSCNQSLKCSNGLCFENFTIDNETATCLTNSSLLTSVGWWKVVIFNI